jgi:hypothetical protein
MNALAERSASEGVCPHCSARIAADQEWCLECGTAVRVRIRPAPDWRAPVAIVAGVVALVAAGLIVALIALSNTADRSVSTVTATAPAAAAPTPTTAATTTTTTTATTTAPAAKPATATTLASWPAGVTGYTVVLGVIPSKAEASASATKIAASGIPAGVLNSSDYSSMRPGDWIVFSGTYSTRAQADAAATHIQARGQQGAYAFSVVPAG